MACNCGKKKTPVVYKKNEKTSVSNSVNSARVASPVRRIIKKRAR